MYSGRLLLFHQASLVEKESGAEEEEEIGDSREPLNKVINFLLRSYSNGQKKTYVQFHFYYHIRGNCTYWIH